MQHLRSCGWTIALLLWGSLACYNRHDYSLTEPHASAILSLQSVGGATTLPADGVSRLALVAKISGSADADKRDILFTTSAGKLIGGTTDATSGGQVVTATSSGEAPIQLQSATQVQAATVTAQVKNAPAVVATLTVQFVAVTPNDVISFVNPPSGPLPADGATLTPITVAVSPQWIGQSVSFTASAGTFVDSPAAVQVNATATAHLMSAAAIGNADVTATINGFARSTAVQFARALPNRILITGVTPLPLPAKDSTTATVTAQLARDVGKVTPGAVATFTATDANQKPVGFFTSSQVATADATGTVTTQYFPTAMAAPGRVTITVTTPGDGGTTLSSSIVVQIVAGTS